MAYKQAKSIDGSLAKYVFRLSDGAAIPFDLANTDYMKFKVDVADGAELQDPEGNVMTQAEADAFLKTLP